MLKNGAGMFAKILKWSAIFVISLMVIAFVSSRILNISLAEDKKIAIDFIEKNSKYIVNMELDRIEPLLAPVYLSEFNSDTNKKAISEYLSHGKVESYDSPLYYGSDSTAGKRSENQKIFYFLIRVRFEKGVAEIKVSLLKSGDSFLIEKFNIKFG
jgi:hypothetical protein